MGKLGIPDRYIDAFYGKVLKKMFWRDPTDFSLEKLKEIYEKANIKVLR